MPKESFSSLRRGNRPTAREINLAISSFDRRQKKVLGGLLLVGFLAFVGWLFEINNLYSVHIAIPGGSLTEGIIGTPRFINPLQATSDADRDLTALIYSGLMRVSDDGQLIPDLAEGYSLSDDGLTYTFTLKEKLLWPDGKPITTDDVMFTIIKAQDPALKSVKRANWEGVTIQKIDNRQIAFSLKKPYSAFLENTTLGILPKHLWGNIDNINFSLNELNTNGLGSGPYQISNIVRDSAGLPTAYELKAFQNFSLGAPKIQNLTIKFFSNEEDLLDALSRGEIGSAGTLPPESLKLFANHSINEAELPRIFSVFINQKENEALAKLSARKALNLAVNRQQIVDQVLQGHGQPILSPLFFIETEQTKTPTTANLEEAKKVLESAGWKKNEKTGIYEIKKTDSKGKTISGVTTLTFTLATADNPELIKVAEILQQNWQALGAQVEIAKFEPGDLNQNIIRPRRFEALLFGKVLGRQPDLFPFWHSSQRQDPGLNIAGYSDKASDSLLEDLNSTADQQKRQSLYEKLETRIMSDMPAIFLYSPYYLYLTPKTINGITLPLITTPAERFSSVHRWYIKTEKRLRFFADKKDIITK